MNASLDTVDPTDSFFIKGFAGATPSAASNDPRGTVAVIALPRTAA